MGPAAVAPALVLVVGCAAPQPDIAFPRYVPTELSLTAESRGRLIAEEGCLVLEGAGGPWMLLWPSTMSLRREAGQLVVIDRNSAVLATVGDVVAIGGGEFRDDEHASRITNGAVPEGCQTGLYLQVTGIPAVP